MTLFYPDVSNNNWGCPQLTDDGQERLYDFLSNLDGFAGVAHKISEGVSFVDPYGVLCKQWCVKNNFPFSGYHFVTNDSPSAQVQNYLNAGGDENAQLDFEHMNSATGGATLNIDIFWSLVSCFNAAGVGVKMAYIPRWYWGDIGQPDLSELATNGIKMVSSSYPCGYNYGSALDLYGASGSVGWESYGGATPSAWQFTSTCNVAFIQPVDCNAYEGTDINDLFKGIK